MRRIRFTKKIAIACATLAVFTLAACAPQPATDATDDVSSSADSGSTEIVFSMDADCGICHTTESTSFADTGYAATNHAMLDGQCTSCHSDEESLSKRHKDTSGDLPTELKKTTVGDESCLACHDSNSLIEATKDSTVLTDKNGTVVNPHSALGMAESHDAEIQCISCHTIHTENSLEERAADFCITCHHAEVYDCASCH